MMSWFCNLMTYHSHCFVRPRSVFLWLSSTAACGAGAVAWNTTWPSSELEASGNGNRFLDAEEAMKHLRGCASTEERAL